MLEGTPATDATSRCHRRRRSSARPVGAPPAMFSWFWDTLSYLGTRLPAVDAVAIHLRPAVVIIRALYSRLRFAQRF